MNLPGIPNIFCILFMIAGRGLCDHDGFVHGSGVDGLSSTKLIVLSQSDAEILAGFLFPYLQHSTPPASENVRRLFSQAVQSLRRQRTTLNPPHTWVEEAPGTIKSEIVQYPPNQLSLGLHTLLEIKKRREAKKKAT